MTGEVRREWAERIARKLGLCAEDVESVFERPPREELGDVALPCFRFAKALRRDPTEIAKQAADALSDAPFVAEVSLAGAFLNIHLDRKHWTAAIIKEILSKGEKYGSSNEGKGRTVIVDFSSPNIAKPFGIGHLRSTVIGNALCRIYRFLNWNVVGINYLGDWGTQVAKMMVAYEKWFDKSEYQRNPIRYLYDLYVRFHKEEEKDAGLLEEARRKLVALESGEGRALSLWRRFVELSKAEFQRIYDILGVSFDVVTGESMCDDNGIPRGREKMEAVLQLLKQKGLVEESEGALIVDFKKRGIDLPPLMLRKRDGSTLYATREVAVALERWRRYRFDLALYVVGMPQQLHFQQVFKLFELAGFEFAGRCRHIAFGHYVGMSTRKGTMVLLEEVLEGLIERAYEVVRQKNPSLVEEGVAEDVARKVAVAALIFNDLKNARIKDVVYDEARMLSLEGDTGPYLQYAHTRICGILRKWGRELPQEFEAEGITSDEEWRLVKLCGEFGRVVREAARQFEPSIIAQFLLDVAAAFNLFYQRHRVLNASAAVRDARLLLCAAAKSVLANGLKLLGIEPLERM